MKKSSFVISFLTVLVQYYDYHLYGFVAASISLHFFPAEEATSRLLNTYLIMALAMIVKPIGSIVLGKIGDSKGRSVSFSLSLAGTGIASFLLFICPSFNTIGYVAIFVLLIARMLISACASSGSDGVRIFVYENVSVKNQCFGVGATTLFTQCGSLIAALVAFLVTLESMPETFWKISFLIGFIMAMVVLYLIKKIGIEEDIKSPSKDLNSAKDLVEVGNMKLIEIIRYHSKLFITCLFLAGCIGSMNQFVIIFFGTYNFEILGTIDKSKMKAYIIAAILAYMFCNLIAGFIADRFGKAKPIIFGVGASLIFSLCQSYYLVHNMMSPVLYILIAATTPFIVIPAAAIYKQSIPKSIRYRLFSLSHSLGSILISAPTSYVCIYLYKTTQIKASPFYYFIATLLVISLSLYLLSKKNDDNGSKTNKTIIK